MNIRQATIDDSDLVVKYLTRFRSEKLNTVLKHSNAPTVESQKIFMKQMDGITGVMFVCIADEFIVGCITGTKKTHPQLSHSCEFGVGVIEEYRGIGIGKKLIEKIEEWAWKTCERIELSVFSNNHDAIQLYSKMGYDIEGRKRGGVYIDKMYYDIIEMAKIRNIL
jgi:RimJ/RimL family protein N-acetyltransferase